MRIICESLGLIFGINSPEYQNFATEVAEKLYTKAAMLITEIGNLIWVHKDNGDKPPKATRKAKLSMRCVRICLGYMDNIEGITAHAIDNFRLDEMSNFALSECRFRFNETLEEAARYGINIPNGMLLYGPPGCGKSFLAERFAEEAGYNYRYVKSSDLASTYLHGSQEKIAQLFDEARTDAPTIICFDEFDALVPRRDDINNASHCAEVNEFLTQLNNCGRHGVFVIATTNRPDRIDSAVLRAGRIDYMIYVPAPDEEAREKLFELAVAQRPHNPGINYKKLARKTTGFMAVDISAVVEQAARIAFRTKTEITQELLGEVLKERKPSMTKSMIAEYDRIREAFDSRECDAPRRQIGFLGF